MPDYTLPTTTYCPHCDEDCTQQHSLDNMEPAEVHAMFFGSVTICSHCISPLEFNNDLTLRPARQSSLNQVPDYDLTNAYKAAIKRRQIRNAKTAINFSMSA